MHRLFSGEGLISKLGETSAGVYQASNEQAPLATPPQNFIILKIEAQIESMMPKLNKNKCS